MISLISRCKSVQKLSSQMFSRKLSSSGTGGDIRGAGGAFGKKEKAQEEQYFRQKEKEELAEFKKKIDEKSTGKSKKSDDKPSKKQ